MKLLRLLAVLVMVGVGCGQASAALLGLTQGPPDITAQYVNLNYNSSNDLLTIVGYDVSVNLDGNQRTITSANYTIDANISNSGALINGTLTALGQEANAGATSGTLLTGTLTEFAYVQGDPNFQQIQLEFNVTGGDFASRYGPTGGVIINTVSGFPCSFASSFGVNNYDGQADTFAVAPEPATMALLLTGAAAGLLKRKGRRVKGQGLARDVSPG